MNTRTQLTESNAAHRALGHEVVELRDRVEKLRKLVVMTDNGYCRCGGCGGTWHAGETEVHDDGCVAAPAKRPRASSSAQKARGAASKRKR